MKELSIEEKAKAYDKALERANNLHKDAVEMKNNMTTKTCEIIFPELVDSEKVRKELLAVIDDLILPDEQKERFVAWLEKQGEQSIKWHKNTEGNKPQKNHSVLIKTTHGIGEGEWNGGEHWIQYRWSGSIKDSDVLFWIELSDIEKQGEQNLIKIPKFKSGDTIEFNGFGHNRYTIKEVCGLSHYINTMGDRMDMSYTDAKFEVVKDSDNVEQKFKVGD